MVVARESNNEQVNIMQNDNNLRIEEALEILNQAKTILKRKLSFFVWQGFFDPLNAESFNGEVLVVSAQTSFHKNWVIDHYMPELLSACEQSYGTAIKVVINASSEPLKRPILSKREVKLKKSTRPLESFPNFDLEEIEEKEEPKQVLPINNIKLELSNSFEKRDLKQEPYTFDSFIQGPSNQMVYEACLSVAENPGEQFSPLFIFGTVGLGKTHLLHAIKSRAMKKNPTLKIIYLSAEAWVNSYVQAIRERKFDSFRSYYRDVCDILLIDDIQFLAGKDASQDEFFHTFNSLHEAKKQIVVTSDKYPHEIEGLEERLRTRLSWGLIADIRPPEIETRLAILHKKASDIGLALDDETYKYLASNLTSSVRELEGALHRISAFSKLTKQSVNITRVKDMVSPVIKRKSVVVSWQKVCDAVSGYYDIKTVDIMGKSRQKQIVFARQVGMSLCRSLLSMSLPEIGKVFGGRDHTTVLSSLRKIDDCKKADLSLQSTLKKLENKILSMG